MGSELVGASGQLHPAPAHHAAVNHEAQHKQYMALIGGKSLVLVQPGQMDALLQYACSMSTGSGRNALREATGS